MNKQKELRKISEEIEKCSECKKGKTGFPVPGEGNPEAEIVFIGEAPGKTEAKTGRPFIGRSGKLLREMIRATGLSEEEVYITSPVKYLPLSGTPSASDIKHGKTHLEKQLSIIDPKVLVLLGASAVKGVLGESIQVIKKHGQIIEKNNKKYFITIHPAAVLRFPKLKPIMEQDFKFLKKLL